MGWLQSVSHLIRPSHCILPFSSLLSSCHRLFHVFVLEFFLNVIPFLLFCPSEKVHLTLFSGRRRATKIGWDLTRVTIIFLGKCERKFFLFSSLWVVDYGKWVLSTHA